MMFGGGIFLWSLILIGIVVLAVWWFQQQQERNSPESGKGSGESRPVEILRERYARGEISQEEFEEKRRNLQDSSGGL